MSRLPLSIETFIVLQKFEVNHRRVTSLVEPGMLSFMSECLASSGECRSLREVQIMMKPSVDVDTSELDSVITDIHTTCAIRNTVLRVSYSGYSDWIADRLRV